ncbi:hypothetical protein G7Z17_g10715 [Cylindrodendrum hubeiense]|uniref:Uncharacterized protein n=1 Tax=Cylindrodendrum hubeiense TaxID=595255 RepID=A0A9P5LCD7_9HYPO|nr:hypothetical protein G7Z17_g10715 [Cylindrodendrum hubeiense]
MHLKENVRQSGQLATKLTAMYLKSLWGAFEKTLPFPIEQFKVHVTFTIPAAWPDDARNRLLRAIEDAGMYEPGRTTLNLLSEPEATAVYLLPLEMHRISPKTNDTIIVCDCGGGTIDSIGLQISQLAPLAVSECIPGECIFAGAAILDDAFHDKFMAKFRAACPAVELNAAAIIVSGGFGRNFAVQETINRMVKDNFPRSIQVITYKDCQGWMAVARGALSHSHALNIKRTDQGSTMVAFRISRVTYGTRGANRHFKQFVEKGTILSTGQPSKFRIDPQEFQLISTMGQTHLMLEVCSRSGTNAVPRRVCKITWLMDETLGSEDSFELGLTHDGMKAVFTLYLLGILQGAGKVAFHYGP